MAIIEPTEEQLQAGFKAAGLTPQEQQAVRLGVPANTITASTIAPTPELNIQNQIQLPTPNVSQLPPVIPPPAPQTTLAGFEEQLKRLESKDITGETITGTAKERKELLEINEQIRQHELRAAQAEEQALQRGETETFATGEAARVRREAAFDALRLNSLAQAKQGNLSLAADLTERSIKAKYEQIENDLKTKRANIIANYDNLTVAEKRRADDLLTRLDAQDTFVKTQKEKEKDLQSIGNKAAAAGAPLSKIQEAMKTGDTIKASSMLADYLKAPGETKPGKDIVFTETTMPPSLRSDIIDTLTDEKGLKALGKELTLIDLTKLFPNVETKTLQNLMDTYLIKVEFEAPAGTKKWWQFWK